MATKAPFAFLVRPEEYAATPVPALSEWSSLWAAWDTVTRQMIPDDELLSKPIKLRNACIFYVGHIPTFLAIHLHRATAQGVEGLEEYKGIFERGIDPDVENPELCHDHSEIPDEWPAIKDVLAFQERVRDQVREMYSTRRVDCDGAVARALWLAFEHEAMHLETLLYMLVQSERTQPPNGTVIPDFEAMARESRAMARSNDWFDIPVYNVTLGLDDDEKATRSETYFGWDNEKPSRDVQVAKFSAKARPITNGEYAKYLEELGIETLPVSWTTSATKNGRGSTDGLILANAKRNGTHIKENKGDSFLDGKSVLTVFGVVPLKFAVDWPVMASYDELIGCANWMGGRIPTMEEVKAIYQYVDELKSKELGNKDGKKIPAVNR
jgi:formylglycine-generating enzyme required for sulfatase activity